MSLEKIAKENFSDEIESNYVNDDHFYNALIISSVFTWLALILIALIYG